MFNRYDAVRDAAISIATKVSQNLKLRVELDEAIFREAFLAAKYSSTFHGSEGDVNHIKKVSHICFWIIKLKPYYTSKFMTENLFDKLGVNDLIGKLDHDYLDRRTKASEAPINEMIALSLSDYLIFKGFANIRKKLESQSNTKEVIQLDERMAANQRRLFGMFHPIVQSYREHNYSARALATMLHLTYSTGHESLVPEVS